MRDELSYCLAVAHLQQINPFIFKSALIHFNTLAAFFNASIDELQHFGLKPQYVSLIKNLPRQNVEADLKWAEHKAHHLIPYYHPHYPPLLKECVDMPLLLFVKGDSTVLTDTIFAIVGSRQPSYMGKKNAEIFAQGISTAGLTVCSGLANGVDGNAHAATLAIKGKTIAIMGTGVDHIYPRNHGALADAIIGQGGALVSEFARHLTPRKQHFPRRNRIISGMSAGVLVVEAALKSGSLVTARHALEQNRPIFAIPGCIHHIQTKGTHYLIRQGAILVESPSDILDEIQMSNPLKSNVLGLKKKVLSQIDQKVIASIDYALTSFNTIILRTGLTVEKLSSILLTLEIDGQISRIPGGYIRDIP